MKEPREIKDRKVRVFTCTPVDFTGDESFFSRDSGLLSIGLRSIGIDSYAVMPGPTMAGDNKGLIRTEYHNLENPDWWRTQKVDGVILYAWALPKFSPITKAIKNAGAKVLLNMDTDGIISPAPYSWDFYSYTIVKSIRVHGVIIGVFEGVLKCLKASLPWVLDLRRLKHMELADVIGVVSPLALQKVSAHCSLYHRPNLISKLVFVPHPVSDKFKYSGIPKKNQIVSVGRWTKKDRWQKDPKLLIRTLNLFLNRRQEYQACIVGQYDETLKIEISRLSANVRDRIYCMGRMSNHDIVNILNETKISLCVSFQESFHIASAEALCCGASIASHTSPFLPSFPYLTGKSYGTLATKRSPESLAEALDDEALAWESGGRDPLKISKEWIGELHAGNVANNALQHLSISLVN
jgi:glycosyltransferase involved in cell wall biosynthesis